MQAEAVAKVKQTLEKAEHKKEQAELVSVRQAAGKRWVDPSLGEWPEGEASYFLTPISGHVL
jgi:hypothetical protein